MKALMFVLTSFVLTMAGTMVHAAEKAADPHAGHQMSAADHAAMGHAAPSVTTGPWSYHGRNNPAPYKTGRWEMVPVPGYGHMFLSTRGLSSERVCAALQNPGVMVDRATRKRCGMPEVPERVSAPAAAPAAHH